MADAIDIGTRRELFVDDLLIEKLKGARLELKKPERREVAFTADAPWEDNVAGFENVVTDGGAVRLYYRAAIPDLRNEDITVMALAESRDGGLSFARPEFGLVEFKGSRKNNILRIGGQPQVPPAFIDTNPKCLPGQRYKGLSQSWCKLYVMCSADGLRWQPMHEGPVEMTGAFDTVNTAFWDSLAGCYRCFTRSWADSALDYAPTMNVRGGCIRTIQGSTSPDFIHWTPPVQNEYADGDKTIHLYTNAIVPCPGAEHIYVGFPNRFVPERAADPKHQYPGVNDALFMSSRDCVHWTRYLDAWVRPDLDPLNWTERNNYPAWGIVETSQTEWSIYISEHYRHSTEPTRLRRLSIRPHGFVSVHADCAGGEMVTRPLMFSRRELRLNYSTSAAGSVRVEIRDVGGKPVKGFALRDMTPMFGDELDRALAWKGGSDLSALAGKPVRLRFVLKDADVFALRAV